MVDLAKLVVRLEAQSSKLTSSLDKAERRAKRWERKTKKNVTNVKAAFVGLGIGIAAVRFKTFVTDSISAADNIAKMSDALGLTTKQFQKLSFGAELSGTGLSKFTSNMTAFVKRVGEARQETGPLVTFLKKYDEELLIAIQRTKTQADALDLIADAMKNAKTKTDEAALASAAFSRGGVTMVNFLREGSRGLDVFSKQAEALGLVIDDSMLRKAEDAEDAMTTLSKVLKVQAVNAVLEYTTEIQQLATALINFTKVAAKVPGFIDFLSDSFSAIIGDPKDIVFTMDRINLLENRVKSFRLTLSNIVNDTGAEGMLNSIIFGESGKDKLIKDIQDTDAEIQRLKTQVETLQIEPPEPIKIEKPEGDGGIDEDVLTALDERLLRQIEMLELSLQNEEQKIAESQERRTFMVENALNDELISYERRAELLLSIDKKAAKGREAIEQRASGAILSIRATTTNAAIGFLQLFANKNKAIAKIIIISQKALAIAQAIQNTAVAVTAMLKYPPGIREGLIAQTKLLGNVQIGLIAATGLGQLAGIGGGGGGGGGGTPSIGDGGLSPQIDHNFSAQSTGGAPTNININVIGGIADRDTAEAIADSLREYLRDGGRSIA